MICGVDSFNDLILEYLKAQEPPKPEVTDDAGKGTMDIVKDVLNDLLDRMERRIALKEEYEWKVKHHNQYPLFDLKEKITDFNIDDKVYADLTFRESLVIGYLDNSSNIYPCPEPEACGGLCLDVQKAKGKNPLKRITPDMFKDEIYKKMMNEFHMDYDRVVNTIEELDEYSKDLQQNLEEDYTKFLIHFSSKFNVNGHDAGKRITSWVDRNFHTIEESRAEFIIIDGVTITKKLYVCLQEGKYFVKHYSSADDLKESKYYSLAKAKDYLSEGANCVLMRYLAITRFVGKLEMSCAYINGDLCRNVYTCYGPESGTFNGKKLDVCRIYRSIIEECGIVHNLMTVMTLQGQRLRQEWYKSPYIIYINPKADVKNVKPKGNVNILLSKDWQNDLQMFSAYLDAKMENSMHVRSYLADHAEIHDLIADYVQQILQTKPNDVIEFTMNYFSAHAPNYFQKLELPSYDWTNE